MTTYLMCRKPKPKVTEATIFKRKEKKKMRQINIYSAEQTGERPPHNWLDGKRLRALAMSYQAYRNKHRHTIKIDKKDQQEMSKFLTKQSEIQYIQEQQISYWLNKFKNNLDNCNKEVETLPFNLREEVKQKIKNESSKHPLYPELYRPFNLYYEQIMRIYPDEMTDSFIVGKRLEKIVDEQLGDAD